MLLDMGAITSSLAKAMNKQTPMNRLPLLDSPIFSIRGERVKWPTIRKAWITDESASALRDHVTGIGRSIIFLDGMYRTNLNQWTNKDPIERAVFFEYLMKHPKVKGGIFLLCWIGNYHNGCIYHCAWQYPQIKCWETFGVGAEKMFERKAFQVYKQVTSIIYKHSEYPMDDEVTEFLQEKDDE